MFETIRETGLAVRVERLMRSATGPVGGYRRPAHPVNPGISVDLVLDFRYEHVAITFARRNHDGALFLCPRGLTFVSYSRTILVRERVQTMIRDDLDPVRRQDAGVASPHTRIGFLPRSAPARRAVVSGLNPGSANVVSRG